MDIHKPRPWHSAREFFKEYVIIVIGVLTALGAEQVAETLHWRHLAQQHAEELHASAQVVALNAIQRLAADGCIRPELQRVAEALRRPDSRWRGLDPDAAGPITDWRPAMLISPARAWPYTAWESAVSDGTLAHLPGDYVKGYAGLYTTTKDILDQQRLLSIQLPELTPLSFDQTLTSQDRARYLVAATQVDRTLAQLDNMTRAILFQAVEGDFWPPEEQIKRSIDATQKRMGDCARAPDRPASTGPQHLPIKRWRRGG